MNINAVPEIVHREVIKQFPEVEAQLVEKHVNMHRTTIEVVIVSRTLAKVTALINRLQTRDRKPTVTMRSRSSQLNASSRCVEKLCRSSRSRSRSLSERAGAKTVRREDPTTSEASTW